MSLFKAGSISLAALLIAGISPTFSSEAGVENDATCGNIPATIVGTAGNDSLRGTSGYDVIAGLGGDDRIVARGGHDLVCAGAGGDLVRGGRGPDFLYGSGGADVVRGNAGGDQVNGQSGDDREVGGRNKDLFGSVYCPNAYYCFVPTYSGADKLVGGRGADAVSFDAARAGIKMNLAKGFVTGLGKDSIRGVETVYGSQHPDVLIGNAKENEIWGGFESRDDRIVGRGGNDRLVQEGRGTELLGGSGDDVLVFGPRAELIGGAGVDLIHCRCGSSITVELAAGTVVGTTFDGRQWESSVSGVENVRAGSGVDALIGNDQANALMGGGKADSLIGAGGNDVLMGGSGKDELFGDEDDDSLDGGPGTNSNDGGEGTDSCINPTADEGALNCEE